MLRGITQACCRDCFQALDECDYGTRGLMQGPPAAKWERETADTHAASRTWGLRNHMLRQLA